MTARLKTFGLIAAIAAIAATVTVVSTAQEPRPADVRLREAEALLSGLHYEEALAAYRQARVTEDARVRVRAGAGITRTLLRLGQFEDAEREANTAVTADPTAATALALHGDALWAIGLFEDAESRYDAALRIDPNDPAAIHGRARSLAAQFRLDDALTLTTRVVAAVPSEPEYLYTLALIHERRGEFQAAAEALDRYAWQLPPGDQTHLVKWARAQQKFFEGFGRRTPLEVQSKADSYVLPIRIVGSRVLVDGSVNGRTAVEFALDTGTDQTILTPAIASKANVKTTTALQSAGVGSMGLGFRDLQLARVEQLQIGGLRVRNVPAVVKDPALVGMPRPEGAGFSPIAFGFSMVLDYETRQLTIARRLPKTEHAFTLPLRVHRLPIIRVMVNGTIPAGFAIDTAGDANALSRRLARRLEFNKDVPIVAARVYGSAGPDPTAFLLPFVRLDLAPGVRTLGESIAVLNLDAPSGLLGVNLGGILGHDFLRRYRLTIDLVRSEVGLDPLPIR
ncbi:MAG TPA: aspartyl protease family protein [Vicinamibacterales bacterium]|nr:aspartyl protease family protein [Vicinamibacterales bacterium]